MAALLLWMWKVTGLVCESKKSLGEHAIIEYGIEADQSLFCTCWSCLVIKFFNRERVWVHYLYLWLLANCTTSPVIDGCKSKIVTVQCLYQNFGMHAVGVCYVAYMISSRVQSFTNCMWQLMDVGGVTQFRTVLNSVVTAAYLSPDSTYGRLYLVYFTHITGTSTNRLLCSLHRQFVVYVNTFVVSSE